MNDTEEMFTEDDIPDFSKLGAGNFPGSVERNVARLDFTTSAAAKAFLTIGESSRETGERYRARSNAISDSIAEDMSNGG